MKNKDPFAHKRNEPKCGKCPGGHCEYDEDGEPIRYNNTHHEPDHREGESIFKCDECGEKYPECFSGSDNTAKCRWCSGDETL